jgi:hypothetical protein
MMLSPAHCLVVGLEDDPSGMLRVYIDHRSYGRYFMIYNEDDKAAARFEWDVSFQGHLMTKRPPEDAIFEDCSGSGAFNFKTSFSHEVGNGYSEASEGWCPVCGEAVEVEDGALRKHQKKAPTPTAPPRPEAEG